MGRWNLTFQNIIHPTMNLIHVAIVLHSRKNTSMIKKNAGIQNYIHCMKTLLLLKLNTNDLIHARRWTNSFFVLSEYILTVILKRYCYYSIYILQFVFIL